MKILMINKFLHPNGGAETYVFQVGKCMQDMGHEIQYFGMEHEKRCVGNNVHAYTSNMDFHEGFPWKKLLYPIKTIYSTEAQIQIRKVLDDFAPDVCHLNNFNYQLTPSIILEIVKWRKDTGNKCRIVYTAHDYQLICPNHMCHNLNSHQNCEKCFGGHFVHCISGKCIHGSFIKSMIGAMEAFYWNKKGVYQYIDVIICCSNFLRKKLNSNSVLATKTLTLHNFISDVSEIAEEKENYVLYLGRFSEEKGIRTLLQVCKELPQIPFVFAGSGVLESELKNIPNVNNVGFLKGDDLVDVIKKAKFSVYPSEWYENCPFSVMESQMYGTPVLGADIGGIPELIQVGKTGELFESGNPQSLKKQIEKLWNNKELLVTYSHNCQNTYFDTTLQYCERLLNLYEISKYIYFI